MVPRPGGHVHVRIAVVDHMQIPEQRHVVHDVVHPVLRYQVKQHDGRQQTEPSRHRYPVNQPNSLQRRPLNNAHGQRTEDDADEHGRAQEGQIGPGVPPASKPAGKQRTDALDDEIQGHADHDPDQLLRGWHPFKEGQKLFHGCSIDVFPR